MSELLLDIRDLIIEADIDGDWRPIVNGLSMALHKGEIIGLIGESGAGKSTFGLAGMGYTKPGCRIVSGSIKLEGEELVGGSPSRLREIRGNSVSYVAQSAAAAFNPAHRLIDQFIEAPVQHGKLRSEEAARRGQDLYRQLDLPDPDHIGNRFPHQVSGGQLQRAMTAMAMGCDPRLIVFDEPTTALDVTIQAQILDLMTKLKDEVGMSILFITHDLGLIEKFSDTITVMQEGTVVEQGDTKSVFLNPQHAYTKKLINSEPSSKQDSLKEEPPLIEVKDLNIFYPLPNKTFFKKDFFHAVKGVNFSIPQKSTIGLVGESGSGKSTLGKALAGLINYQGSVFYDGVDTNQLNSKESKSIKKDIQIVFQDPYGSLSPRMTVGEIVGEGLDVHFDLTKKQKDERIADCLKAVEINPDDRFKYPHEFSGGQRQRVAIARSLILNPSFMVLDEPTSALDRSIQIQVIELLKNIQAEYELTYLFISHDLKVVRSMSDYIFVMQNGCIVESGPAKQVFSNPEEDYTDKLLNAALRYSTV